MNHIEMMKAAWLSPDTQFACVSNKVIYPPRVRMDAISQRGFECTHDNGKTWKPLTPSVCRIESYTWEKYVEPTEKKPETYQRKLLELGKQLGVHSAPALIEFAKALEEHIAKKYMLDGVQDEKYAKENILDSTKVTK